VALGSRWRELPGLVILEPSAYFDGVPADDRLGEILRNFLPT